jgi:cystine transport system substrate-binding protein
MILTSAIVLSVVLSSDNSVNSDVDSDGKAVQHLETTELKDTTMDIANKTKQEIYASKGRRIQLQKRASDLGDMIISVEKEIQDRKKDAVLRSMLEEFNIELENMTNNIKQGISVLKVEIEQHQTGLSGLFNNIISEEKKWETLSGGSLSADNLNKKRARGVEFNKNSSLGNFRIPRSSELMMQERRAAAVELFNQQVTLENSAQGLEAQISELKNQFESNKSKLDNLIKKRENKKQVNLVSSVGAPSSSSSSLGKSFIANATAYSCQAASMGRFSCYGIDLLTQPMVVAVDPKVIPLGSRVWVDGYGEAIAGDTGSAIKGNCIDLHFPTYKQSCQWGRRWVRITVLS